MTEANLLELFNQLRTQMDMALAQTIAITLAVLVGVYYFIHRAGRALKLAVAVLYVLGWYLNVSSGALAAQMMMGVLADLQALVDAGTASQSTRLLLKVITSTGNTVYVIAANAANFLLLIGSLVFLFFWQPPPDSSPKPAEPDQAADKL